MDDATHIFVGDTEASSCRYLVNGKPCGRRRSVHPGGALIGRREPVTNEEVRDLLDAAAARLENELAAVRLTQEIFTRSLAEVVEP